MVAALEELLQIMGVAEGKIGTYILIMYILLLKDVSANVFVFLIFSSLSF